MSSCALYPTINVGGEERRSTLFDRIKEFTGSYEQAWNIWGLTQSPTYMQDKSVKYDENGEPTFESLNKAIDIRSLAGSTIKGDEKTLGAKDSKGNPIVYKTASEIVDKVIEYNESNPDRVASIGQIDKGYVISIEDINKDNSDKPGLLVFSNELNNKLLGIMRSLGFDARVNEGLAHNGIFTPLTGVETAEGLKTVIEIAKGLRGEEAFPEEFSHWLIQGMSGNTLVNRLLNAVSSEDIQRRILGDSYDSYYKAYQGNQSRMMNEAAGHLLAEHIKGSTTVTAGPLLSRLWSFFKNLFSKVSFDTINQAINEANEIAGEITSMIHDNTIVDYVDESKLIGNEELYSLSNNATRIEDIANQALEVASRRLKLIQTRSRNKRYDKTEMNQIKELQRLIEKKRYVKGCTQFLNNSIEQIQELQDELKKLNENPRNLSVLDNIRRLSFVLRTIKEFSEGYVPVISRMEALEGLVEIGEVDMSEEDAAELSGLASRLSRKIKTIADRYQELRYRAVYDFLKLYWGEDNKTQNIGKNKGRQMTLELIMKEAEKDINGIDRWVQSMASTSDPMLNLIDKAVRMSHKKRDAILEKMMADIRGAHKALLDAGESSDFMYERDNERKLTGRLISDRDFIKYNKELEAYKEALKAQNLEKYQIVAKLDKWEHDHTEPVQVNESRTERLPKKSLYPSDAVDRLNSVQKEYYYGMMEVKSSLENLLPTYKANRYRAVQIRNDMVQAIGDNWNNPKKLAKLAVSNLKDSFIRREDDTEFGDIEERSSVMLDFLGNPVNRLPIYYTRELDNMDRLSTDFSSSLIAYAGMAVNYSEMNKIIDVLELTREYVHERDVKQWSGDKQLKEVFTVLHNKFSKNYVKPGYRSNIGDRIDDYYEQIIYGKSKKDEGTVTIPFTNGKVKLDKAKSLDSVKSYTGAVGLGLSVLTGLNNVTVGKMQILIEAIAGQYYGYKNSINGKKKYYALLPAALAEANSVKKTSFLNLLMEKFNVSGDFFSKSQNEKLYNRTIERIFGRGSIYFLMTAGEHYLRGRTMLAMLDAFKVYDNSGNEMSLDEAFELKEIKDDNGNVVSAYLELKEGLQDKDGNAITEETIQNYALKIGRVSDSLNGAFGEDDAVALQRYALGRMAMQFRRWMPEHYNRRFAGEYYDAIMEEWREGFYRTVLRFSGNIANDLRKGQFNVLTQWHNLNNAEKANIKRAMTEVACFYALSTLLMMMGPAKDKKGRWAERLLIYNLHRMKLEAGASYPINTDFLNNIWTLLQSPAASVKSFNNIANLLEFQNMFIEIESGRYKGWTKYERDLSLILPIYGQGRKLYDLATEDYMFQMFNK